MIIPFQLKIVAIGATAVTLIQLLNSISAPLERASIQYPSHFSFYSSALANTPPKAKPKLRYVPPSRRPPKSTKATVTRGCEQSEQSSPITLTLLAPKDHDGLTISGHPTFFWHVSAPVAMTFTLTQPGVVQPILEQQIPSQKAGIIQLKMPQELPELVVGKEYRWSVTPRTCNSARASKNDYIQSWIKRVPATVALTQQLAAATTEQDRASIYAQAGLWYDALEAISTAHNTHPNDKSILEERLLLLEQAGQTELAAQERQRLGRPAVQQ